ncbi:MAG: LamG-like jellyroll fold domain-containing protein [Salinivirgaceae bacterium]
MIFTEKITIKSITFIGLLCLILFAGSYATQAQQLAFPGAEGFGKYATGGRGGQVIKVSNLNDNGEGSLRWAIDQNYPRIIVFEVSGTIYLKSRLKIKNGNVTIAGQTAPGHGITLAHYNFYVEAENVIIRHIRSRLSAEAGQQDDAFNVIGSTHVIVDHCSFSWSVDEVASLYHNKKFTLQNCIIAESFHNSIHEKGAHGYGGIWGGDSASFHHNLIMHNTSRNPRFHGARWYTDWEEHVDFRNNVIYNWASNTIYGGEPSEIDGSPVFINIVNNYYKYGPATSSSTRDRIVDPDPDGTYGFGKYYINGNYTYGSPEVTADNWLGVDNVSETVKEEIKSETPFPFDITTIHTAEEAYEYVLQNVGACIPYRDTVDRRLLWEVANDTALYGGSYGDNKGIVDNLEDVGGYPELFTDWAPADTDADGLPDYWETENGLDPNNASDNQTILEGNTYPAIEEYINSILASNNTFMYQPTYLEAELTQIKEISLWWKDNSSDETAFFVWRSEGDAFECIDTLPANTTFCTDTNVVFDKTYLYKLQAINEADSSAFSNIATASTLGADGRPKPADEPSPEFGANNVSTSLNLSWKPGIGAKSHDVYLGTSYPPPFLAHVDNANYTAAGLNHNTRYYWRVDEINENGTTEGTVWNFMTRNEFPQELIAHFSFNQPISVNDVSGNGISGTGYNIKVADFVDGHYGKGILFDGGTKYCMYPHNEKINFDNNAFTISFWIKQDLSTVDRSRSQRYIVKGSNVKNDTEGRSGKRYEVYYTPDKNLFRFCVDDNVTKSEITVDETLFITNDWVHVVAVRDTTEKKLFLYANTELVGQVADATGNIAQSEPMYFSYCVDEDGYVQGIMDEVQLYGYALNPTQIESLYTNGFVSVKNRLAEGFQLFPNPSSGKITIKTPDNITIETIKLTDVTGRTLLHKSNTPGSSSQIDLNLEALTKLGQQMLIVSVQIEGQVYFQKLILN